MLHNLPFFIYQLTQGNSSILESIFNWFYILFLKPTKAPLLERLLQILTAHTVV